MGLVEFFILVFVCCLLAWGLCWLLAHFAPGTPPFVPFVVWAVACIIIVVALLRALGLYGIDPQIPRLR